MAFANVYQDFFTALLEKLSSNDPAPTWTWCRWQPTA